MTEKPLNTPLIATVATVIHKGCLVLEDYSGTWEVDYFGPGSLSDTLGMDFSGNEEWWVRHHDQNTLTTAFFKYAGVPDAS